MKLTSNGAYCKPQRNGIFVIFVSNGINSYELISRLILFFGRSAEACGCAPKRVGGVPSGGY